MVEVVLTLGVTLVLLLITVHSARGVRPVISAIFLADQTSTTPPIVSTLPVHECLLCRGARRCRKMLLKLRIGVICVVRWIDVGVIKTGRVRHLGSVRVRGSEGVVRSVC